MKTKRTILIILIAALLVAGCEKTQNKVQAVANNGPRAWIDAPLDGSTLPLAPYEVVFHVSAADGVAQGELSVNGQVLVMQPNPDPASFLVALYQLWVPGQPGNYTLRARAQSKGGQWSEYAVVNVTVFGPSETPTPTQTPLTPTTVTVTTVTPTPTSTPTRPAPPPPPPPVQQELTFTPSVSTNQISYGGCGADRVKISVQVSDPSVYSVDLYVRLLDEASGSQTEWSNYNRMSPRGGGLFDITVVATNVPDYGRYPAATLVYEFVAVDRNEVVIGRSPRIRDIGFSACGVPPPPVQVITTVAPYVPPPPVVTVTVWPPVIK